MCEIDQDIQNLPTGGINIDLTCKKSGKPITHSNEYGMYCDDECTLQEDKKAHGQLEQALSHLSDDPTPEEFGNFAKDLAKMFGVDPNDI